MVNKENDQPQHGFIGRLLTDAFGRPRGVLGRLGGYLMARSNRDTAVWLIDLLDVQTSDQVLEIGFGPGVAIELLSQEVVEGKLAGIDISEEMVFMARKRNQEAITLGKVELRHASVMALPYEANQFSKVLSINSMQLWPNAETGLKEIYRVMRPGGTIALGFTSHARPRPAQDEIVAVLAASGFKHARIETKEEMVCVLGETGLDGEDGGRHTN